MPIGITRGVSHRRKGQDMNINGKIRRIDGKGVNDFDFMEIDLTTMHKYPQLKDLKNGWIVEFEAIRGKHWRGGRRVARITKLLEIGSR